MDLILLKQLPLLNSVILAAMFLYLSSKAYRHSSVFWFAVSLIPLIIFQTGTYLFLQSSSRFGSTLVVLGINLIPVTFTPFGRVLGRDAGTRLGYGWRIYYGGQILLLIILCADLISGEFIDWVTGIFDQPVILIEKTRRFIFINPLLGAGLTLLAYENTVKNARRSHIDALNFVVVAYIGFIAFIFNLTSQVLFTSYIPASVLVSGSGIVFVGIVLLS